jgi:hypothetical protein
VSQVFKEFCKKLGIKSSMLTAYHPQTDGQTKQVNQLLKNYLCIFCHHRQDDWEKYLPSAEFSYNNVAHKLTKLSPFYVKYGMNVMAQEGPCHGVRYTHCVARSARG